jgi:hypothetical protein
MNEDVSFVTLNPSSGATDEDVVVFPAFMTPNPTEGASIRFFLDTQVPLLGGTSSAIRGGRTTGTAWDTANRGSDSVAFGLDGLASGAQSVVLGGDSGQATGVNSLAFGGGVATGDGSVAFNGATAVGADSVAFGPTGSARGARSFALNDTAFGNDSVVFAATGGFYVNGNGAGVPAALAGDIYLDANNVVCTGKLTGALIRMQATLANPEPVPAATVQQWTVTDTLPAGAITRPVWTDSLQVDRSLNTLYILRYNPNATINTGPVTEIPGLAITALAPGPGEIIKISFNATFNMLTSVHTTLFEVFRDGAGIGVGWTSTNMAAGISDQTHYKFYDSFGPAANVTYSIAATAGADTSLLQQLTFTVEYVRGYNVLVPPPP